uniref:MRP-S28 domain-containing protein n=2 Tax=Ascaris lumbricoides TaxID=6252 RepID=A0A0M3INY1_ASCLU
MSALYWYNKFEEMLVLRKCGLCGMARGIAFRRSDSTLAEKMMRASEGVELTETEAKQRDRLEVELDEKGEPFRELFVMPRRKLNAQIQLERLTGRAKMIPFSRLDINDRLAVRRARCEEMRTDQDWPSVWPVAASFRSSVVPLPIRMGSRPHPDRRPGKFPNHHQCRIIRCLDFVHSFMQNEVTLQVRRARCEEMRTDQDWPSVWPVAASFRSSVVPLPIRMGSRPHPDRRPPFQKLGNLELVKIPNFLHLTPAAIERHCKAIKKFCTSWPAELIESKELRQMHFPVTASYSDYVHQGTSLRDPRARIVTVTLKLASLKLNEAAYEKFMRLAGNRYDEATDTLTIVTDRCYTRKQNKDYAFYLLTALYHESIICGYLQKVEAWEKMVQRADDLKVKYEGSTTQRNVQEILEQLAIEERSHRKDPTETSTDLIAIKKEEVKKFADMWEKCRNEVETPDSVRRYGECVKNLLGIKPLEAENVHENK